MKLSDRTYPSGGELRIIHNQTQSDTHIPKTKTFNQEFKRRHFVTAQHSVTRHAFLKSKCTRAPHSLETVDADLAVVVLEKDESMTLAPPDGVDSPEPTRSK